ncbi:hypothetical protein E4T44_04310 [Aureobasidium sp. EXF-8845]|nr:hypothetical protein E4T44_04310 [Aureobasidium sp. EXF-8845]KAI4856452.1 hypothetical protein E4T45_02087 [Aureobasidium sp. EXF-8846]
MGLPVWRNPEEARSSNSNSPAAVSRVKNDSTATSRSPIRRLRATRPPNSYRVGQPPSVPEAPRRVPSSDRSFDLTHYLSDENLSQERHPEPSRRRSRTDNFLPPPLERDRPQSRNGVSTSLPSPPRDTSEPTASSRILLSRPLQSSPHPLSFTHRPVSPDDGLGDRNRSPSPSAWNVIGSTITPDDSLPSADSSFASTIPAGIITQAEALADVLAEDSSSTINESQNHDRRTVEALLYDFAMQTVEGRAQIELLRQVSPEDARWIRHHSTATQDDGDNEDDNESYEAPPQRPSQYGSDIRERSRQVAASTMRYFGNTRNELNASQDVGQLRRVETPSLSRSTSTSRSRLLANLAARRSEIGLARLTPEAEEFTGQV